jgi:hypothetical protein
MLICYIAEIVRQIRGGECASKWKVMEGINLKNNFLNNL